MSRNYNLKSPLRIYYLNEKTMLLTGQIGTVIDVTDDGDFHIEVDGQLRILSSNLFMDYDTTDFPRKPRELIQALKE